MVAYSEDYGSDPSSWPEDIAGRVYIGRALERIGKALFPKHWSGGEFYFESTSNGFANKSKSRLLAAINVLHTYLKVGGLRTFTRSKLADGIFTEYDQEVWNCPAFSIRFITGKLDPTDPLSEAKPNNRFEDIYVDESSLAAIVTSVRIVTNNLRGESEERSASFHAIFENARGSQFVPKGHIRFGAGLEKAMKTINQHGGPEEQRSQIVVWLLQELYAGDLNGFYLDKVSGLVKPMEKAAFIQDHAEQLFSEPQDRIFPFLFLEAELDGVIEKLVRRGKEPDQNPPLSRGARSAKSVEALLDGMLRVQNPQKQRQRFSFPGDQKIFDCAAELLSVDPFGVEPTIRACAQRLRLWPPEEEDQDKLISRIKKRLARTK